MSKRRKPRRTKKPSERESPPSLERRLADVIGIVASGGGDSRRTGRCFTTLLRNRAVRARPGKST